MTVVMGGITIICQATEPWIALNWTAIKQCVPRQWSCHITPLRMSNNRTVRSAYECHVLTTHEVCNKSPSPCIKDHHWACLTEGRSQRHCSGSTHPITLASAERRPTSWPMCTWWSQQRSAIRRQYISKRHSTLWSQLCSGTLHCVEDLLLSISFAESSGATVLSAAGKRRCSVMSSKAFFIWLAAWGA